MRLASLCSCSRSSLRGARPPRGRQAARKTLYQDGPEGRYLVGGPGCSASTPPDQGLKQRFSAAARPPAGRRSPCPNVWNVGDDSVASMSGRRRLVPQGLRAAQRERRAGLGRPLRVGQLPRARLAQRQRRRPEHRRLHPVPVRPQRRSSAGASTGSSCAWTRAACRPTSRPRGLNADGVPTGGWWNYGGIQREVYLQRDRHAWLRRRAGAPACWPAARCAAQRRGRRSKLRNVAGGAERASVTGRFGSQALRLGTRARRRGDGRRSRHVRRASRSLWSPADAAPLRRPLTVRAGGAKVAGYDAAQRHPLDQGRPTGASCSTAAT